MHLAILECGGVAPQARARYGGYGGMFQALLAEQAPEIHWHLHDVVRGTLPAPEAYDAYLITGSRRAVTEPRPWILQLRRWLNDDVLGVRPVVGCCFGAQLLALAQGGSVEPNPRGWDLGLRNITPLPATEEPAGEFAQQLTRHLHAAHPPPRIHECHGDAITSLPQGWQRLACSRASAIEIFSAPRVLGLQGHPEFDDAIVEELRQRLALSFTQPPDPEVRVPANGVPANGVPANASLAASSVSSCAPGSRGASRAFWRDVLLAFFRSQLP